MKPKVLLFIFLLVTVCQTSAAQEGGSVSCPPTPADMLGPFYKPNAPVRNQVGAGYVLTGKAQSTDCRPLPQTRIEYWLAGPDGEYGDRYRGIVITDKNGGYRIETHQPPRYGGRPPHIHLRVTAEGHETLVTQHYPQGGKKSGEMDLVLEPER